VIEPWGKDSLRVRSTMRPVLHEENWALLPAGSSEEPEISLGEDGRASITNGRITARVDPRGQIGFFNPKGDLLLEEFCA
jgi:alpha-D-xyloside xylohydrolase